MYSFLFLRKLTKYIDVEEVTKIININSLGCVGGKSRITTSFITTSGLKKAAKRLTWAASKLNLSDNLSYTVISCVLFIINKIYLLLSLFNEGMC